MKKVLSAVMVIFAVLALSSCAKSYDEQQTHANVQAKILYTAVKSAINEYPDIKITEKYIYGSANGEVKVCFDGEKVINLSDWLGKDFSGYYYIRLDPENGKVKYVLWSDYKIDMDYYEYVDYTDRAYFDGTEHAIGYWNY